MSLSEVCFQLKGSNITSIVLELKQYPSSEFSSQLQDKVAQAPQLFADSAVVISLEKYQPENNRVDFKPLIASCFEAGLHPMAFRGVDEALLEAVKSTGLPSLPGAGRSAAVHVVEEDNNVPVIGDGEQVELSLDADSEIDADQTDKSSAPEVKTIIETRVETRVEVQEKLVYRTAKIIERPVRGGQQIYAEGCDLIVLAQVSEGAEVIADGNIHIYAPLRGRALAGVKGDSNARIFCQAARSRIGIDCRHFILSDELKDKAWKQAAHIQLKDERLNIAQINDK